MYDFRSDTVTRPTPAMLAAMTNADVGDDVFGDDPTVMRLEELAAEMAGKEAALFVSSGTQSNLAALMAHCERGEEYIVGQNAHCYMWEAGGAAVLGSIQPHPIVNETDGRLATDAIEAAIKPDDAHFARTRLIALENTIGGQVLQRDYMEAVADIAGRYALKLHLDGARAFNACTALGIDLKALAAPFDSVSICLSKGLGTPVGSVLVGDREFIARARRLRKMLGGGMRQAGYLAAAGIYALENNISRLEQDHARASRLAEGFGRHKALSVKAAETNMVFVDVAPDVSNAFNAHLKADEISVTTAYGSTTQRWVTHLDVDDNAVDAALASTARFFS